MKILVCCKYVRDSGEIKARKDRSIDLDAAPWEISQYDTVAMEAAMQLARMSEGSEVEVLTVGGEVVENSKMRKAVLSRGPEKMYAIKSSGDDLLNKASLIAQAVERIGGVDVVVFGEGSGDMYSQILGVMVGEMLHVPALNAVSAMSIEEDKLVVTRTVGARSEHYRISYPAVVAVTSDICRAKIPSMKDILAAGKKPVEVWREDEFASASQTVEALSVMAPESRERKRCVLTSEDGAQEFAAALRDALKGVE